MVMADPSDLGHGKNLILMLVVMGVRNINRPGAAGLFYIELAS